MIILFGTFLVIILMGAPIVFAFAISSFAYIWSSPTMTGQSISGVLYSSLDAFPLMAIPFFIFAGDLMVQGKISRRIIDFVKSIVGKVKGYLGAITVIASAFFSAVSGSGVATVAAIGSMMFPEMEKANYPKGYSAALVASAAYLGIIIPPSIPMIMFGFLTNTSISELFIGGIVPGLIIALCFIVMNYFFAKRLNVETAISGSPAEVEMASTVELEENKSKILKIWNTGRGAVLALLMPVIIIGGIYGGIFTPTESAVVAVFYSLLVGGIFYREITVKSYFSIAKNSALNTAMLMITLVFASVFARIITLEQIPRKLADSILSISDQKWITLLIILVFLLIVGMFMDALTGIILVTPILYPIAVTGLGLDPVHFGIVVVVTLAVGLITPPMAVNLLLAARISGASVKDTIAYILPFVGVSLVVVLLVTYLPIISLGLSKLLS